MVKYYNVFIQIFTLLAKFQKNLILLWIFTEPGSELLFPHALKHLGSDDVGSLIVHLLPLIIGSGSLSVVVLGEDLHLWRMRGLLARVELVHVNLILLGSFSVENLIELFTQRLKDGILFNNSLVYVYLVIDEVCKDVIELLNLLLQSISVKSSNIKRFDQLLQLFLEFLLLLGLEFLLISKVLLFLNRFLLGGGRFGISFITHVLSLSFGSSISSFLFFLHLNHEGLLSLNLLLPLLLVSPELLDVVRVLLPFTLPLHHGLLHCLLFTSSGFLQLHHHLPLPLLVSNIRRHSHLHPVLETARSLVEVNQAIL